MILLMSQSDNDKKLGRTLLLVILKVAQRIAQEQHIGISSTCPVDSPNPSFNVFHDEEWISQWNIQLDPKRSHLQNLVAFVCLLGNRFDRFTPK